MLFISHDLAVVRSLADRVAVLFQGHLFEIGDQAAVFAPPFIPTRSRCCRRCPTSTAAAGPARWFARSRGPCGGERLCVRRALPLAARHAMRGGAAAVARSAWGWPRTHRAPRRARARRSSQARSIETITVD